MKNILLLLSIMFIGQIHGQVAVQYDSIYHWTSSTTPNTWNYKSKSINFNYNTHHDELGHTDLNWGGTSWTNQNNYINTYNILYKKTSAIKQNWSGTAWTNYQRDTFYYDINNYEIMDKSQSWSGSNWTTTGRDTLSYDVNHNLIDELFQFGNDTIWTNNGEDSYTYNANNIKTSLSTAYWSGGMWNYGATVTYTYNANNYMTYAYVSPGAGSPQQYFYSYDTNNNLIGETWQLKNGTTWVTYETVVYTYNVNNVMKTKVQDYFDMTSGAHTGGDSAVYYINSPAGINQFSNLNSVINFYPNPTSDQFFIETSSTDKLTVDLYDVNGRHVFSKNVIDKSAINVSDLQEGVYNLAIKTVDGVTNKKLVIVR